jgi:hypothetical protein
VTARALIDRIRVVEHRLARADHSRAAAELMHRYAHALGNAIQVVDLASFELVNRAPADMTELLAELRTAAQGATATLAAMTAATHAVKRTELGPPVAPAIRDAMDLVRPAITAAIELRIELVDAIASHLLADELEAIVLACALDVADASHIAFALRERTIDLARWIELVRIDDHAGEPSSAFEPPSLLAVVDELARTVGGELTISAGRDGRELVLAWPIDHTAAANRPGAR